MRLTSDDLLTYCKVMKESTNNLYAIIATKNQYGDWKLEIQNNENWATEMLLGGATTREAYEALRAIYALCRFLNV